MYKALSLFFFVLGGCGELMLALCVSGSVLYERTCEQHCVRHVSMQTGPVQPLELDCLLHKHSLQEQQVSTFLCSELATVTIKPCLCICHGMI